MKKIYFSIITILAGASVNAQTLTDSNHSPSNGDMYSTYQCDSLGINVGPSGANALWNFSTITTHSSVVNNYTAVTNANAAYPMPGVQVSANANNTSYLTSNSTDLKYWGGNMMVGTTAVTLVYTTSAVFAAYPMSLNSSSSSVTGGSITVASVPGTFTGNSSTIADGTGTLAIPGFTYNNAIRVVTTQTINFTLPPFATGTVTQASWDYYNVGTKEALFSISTSTIVSNLSSATTQTIVTRAKHLTTGINENHSNKASLAVYPNPSSTYVNFSTENAEAKQVIISDVTGKLVEKQNLIEGKLKLDVSAYTTGLYLYSVIGNTNQTIMSGKITVNH